ncbi:MAG: hypothetical protein A3E88_04570 [Legionellales bacterium RIFCSPHIGHO2_12_FULL_35_11]|nr:MAG: hypothetical protein A3E88_04570 [Legionellales bacterium RIFCSPHIGHO2_12_FULL_35_11]
MSKQTWRNIQNSKRFYVRVYRKLGTILLFSVALNGFLGMAIYHLYFSLPEPDFYATYGDIPPILLTALDEPSYSSTPLLATDVQADAELQNSGS